MLLHDFGSPRRSSWASSFLFALMLPLVTLLHSCGRSGDFHKEVTPKAESEGDSEPGSAESAAKLTAAQRLVLRQLELFPR